MEVEQTLADEGPPSAEMPQEDGGEQVVPQPENESLPVENDENGEEPQDEEMAENDEDEEEEEKEGALFGSDNEEDDDDVTVTIGDIKTNVPVQRRGYPVQKLDPNVTPTVGGKNIFDVNPAEHEERPWLKPGANISDYFNFGFTEETWNEYAEKQRLLRLEYSSQLEINSVIMDELRERHGNKDTGLSIVTPVYNPGGRNLVTVQNVESKPPVKVGFNNPPLEVLPPMIRNVIDSVRASTNPATATTNSNGNPPGDATAAKPMVVDLTKPLLFNPNLPPPGYSNGQDKEGAPGEGKSDQPPGISVLPPTNLSTNLSFNPNMPPPNFVRIPSTNLSSNRMMNPMYRPMGNYYPMMGSAGMGGSNIGMGAPPPLISRQSGDQPPGVGGSSSRQSLDAPPGTDLGAPGTDLPVYRGDRRDRDRRRDSDGSDDERRRKRFRDDRDRERDGSRRRRESPERYDRSSHRERERERPRERDRDREERKRRSSRDRESERDRDRDDRKRRSSRDREERSGDRERERKRYKGDEERESRRHRRDRPKDNDNLDEGPPGV